MEFEKNFSERFKELISNSNLSYIEIAEGLGFKSKGTISKYASGKTKNIDINVLIKIAEYFKVSPVWLIGITDDKYYNPEKADPKTKKLKEISGNTETEIEYIEENLTEKTTNKKQKEQTEYISAKILENTMYPILIKNDIAIIKKEKHFKNGDFVAIDIDKKKSIIRKVWESKETITFQTISPDYEPIILTNEEMRTMPIEIIGVVEQMKRNFRCNIKS